MFLPLASLKQDVEGKVFHTCRHTLSDLVNCVKPQKEEIDAHKWLYNNTGLIQGRGWLPAKGKPLVQNTRAFTVRTQTG